MLNFDSFIHALSNKFKNLILILLKKRPGCTALNAIYFNYRTDSILVAYLAVYDEEDKLIKANIKN